MTEWGTTVDNKITDRELFGGQVPLPRDVVESGNSAEYVERAFGWLFYQAVGHSREVGQELDWATFRVAAHAEPGFGGVVLRLEVAAR